jgi:recombination protein RecA
MGAAAVSFDALLAQLGARLERADRVLGGPSPLVLGWPEVDEALPDGGLPRAVVELTSPHALGSTSIAIAAVKAAQAKDARAWCAWIDPDATLYAPGLAAAGIDLERLLVVRPPRAELARFALKVAQARAFDVVVVDMDPLPGFAFTPKKKAWPPEVLVRKLALASEQSGAAVLLLTDSRLPRAAQWPVALRLEVARTRPTELALAVAKDRRGRVGATKIIPRRVA